jgi:hypothetical protein
LLESGAVEHLPYLPSGSAPVGETGVSLVSKVDEKCPRFDGQLGRFSGAWFQNWVGYAKPPFGGPHHVLGYLARYTHRVAIANHRLVAFDHDQVTFRWKDYAHGNKIRRE